MSSATLLSEANELVVYDDHSAALPIYTAAIKAAEAESDTETQSKALLARSACHYKLKKLSNSVADAQAALVLTPGNSRALLQKGMATFDLGEFESAKKAFSEGLAANPSESRFKTWIRKCEAEIAAEDEDEEESSDDEEDGPPPLEVDPTVPAPTPVPAPSPSPAPSLVPSAAVEEVQSTPAPVAPKKPSIRHEWFQTPSQITVDIFQKAVTEDQLTVDIQAKEVSVIIQLGDGKEFQLDLALSDDVVPAESKYIIRKTKVELRLKKLRSGKWPTLENAAKVSAWDPVVISNPLQYPSSSRSALKSGRDWKKLAKEAGGEEEDKLEGDAALNQVFRGIYKNASDEQRMAMMKSFQESGGTVLSTNWDEVGEKKVEGAPPKGMEMHSWDEKNH
eukprot:TRINITY_DN3139_c0_g1_i1.p1 TRINITY_DN3139_c0_g1~~TRINITY_DN3139_c0_g1_i1.p1  ORF type:complete len:414 (-),score=145.36 TRINITY_DN3139_c0_g1_i1:54-1232(-)